MNLLKTALVAAVLAPLLATPTMATTDGGAYLQHVTDCLGLLFSDLKAHEAQCGPLDAPPFWFPTGGSGPAAPQCETGEVRPIALGRPLLIADTDPCGSQPPLCPGNNGSLSQPFPDSGKPSRWPWDLVLPFRDGTLVAGC